MKSPPTIRDSCGTNAGYQKHYRAGEQACPACLEAHKTQEHERRIKNRTNLDTQKDETVLAEQLSKLTMIPVNMIAAQAHCTGRTHLLFPLDGNYAESRKMCADCPMRSPCRTTGITEILLGDTPMGMYGGLSPQELRAAAQPFLDGMHRNDAEQESRLEQILRLAKDLSKAIYGPQNQLTRVLQDAHLEVEHQAAFSLTSSMQIDDDEGITT